VTAVLDAGALIAIDRRERTVGAILRLLHRHGVPVVTSAGVVAQVWRNGRQQANLARMLSGMDVVGFDELPGKKIGELLAVSRTTDIVDAHVALLVGDGDRVLTSDSPDIEALLETRRVLAEVIHV
jgi:sugar/nucleoside kinase (ribokinase family)